MDKPLVSILICTYNAEKTIKETLDSCLNQTYKDFEILIHDDLSKDKTIEIIKGIKDKKIRIIESGKKLGPYKGLNFLLDHAKGDYIAIQDHDDLWKPEKLEKQVKFLEKNEKYVGCGTKTLMRYEGDDMGFEYYLGKENYYTIHPSLMFRNNGYRYPNRVYMNDAYFQKKILCNGKNLIGNIDETLTIHRIKPGTENYSYKWFKFTRENLNTIFYLHPVWYGMGVVGFEILRKLIYPILHRIKRDLWIDKIERWPFRMEGHKIYGNVISNFKNIMKLSIITCTYNSEKYLQECIDSVIAQNLDIDIYEHIFVDAYSTDKTKSIITKYMKNHSNVRLIECKPKGVYNAMNEGIKEAKGEYILCLNSDDYLEKNILLKYLGFIKNTGKKDLYYGDVVFFMGSNQKNTKKYKSLKKLLFRMFGAQVLIFHPGVLMKKTSFLDLGMFDESKKIASDYGLFLCMLKNRMSYIYFPYTTTYFREHPGGLSSNKENQKINATECEYFRNKYLPKYKKYIYDIVRFMKNN